MISKTACNLIINDLLPKLKKKGISVKDSPVTPSVMARFVLGKELGTLTTKQIRQEMDKLLDAH